MELSQIAEALASLKGFHSIVGIMGGEPLLHPQFEEICKLARSYFPKEQLGLWSAFPPGKEHYREVICETFGNVLLNDHHRPDIFHQPVLVSAEELIVDPAEMYVLIDTCWVQNSWSASINPNGAFFCEIAAAWSILLGEDASTAESWKPVDRWFWKSPKDFKAQIEHYCHRCGAAAPLNRRSSWDTTDDISPNNYELLKDKSPKLKRGEFKIHNLECISFKDQQPMAMYKEQEFREEIAHRYEIYLTLNARGYHQPWLAKGLSPRKPSLYNSFKEKWDSKCKAAEQA